jgi:hypothetical protein
MGAYWMNACEENNPAEQIRSLKDASKFLGACFQKAAQQNHIVHGEGYLKQIHVIEMKIKILEGKL